MTTNDQTGYACGHNYNDPANPCPTCANDRPYTVDEPWWDAGNA